MAETTVHATDILLGSDKLIDFSLKFSRIFWIIETIDLSGGIKDSVSAFGRKEMPRIPSLHPLGPTPRGPHASRNLEQTFISNL